MHSYPEVLPGLVVNFLLVVVVDPIQLGIPHLAVSGRLLLPLLREGVAMSLRTLQVTLLFDFLDSD